MSKKEVLGVDKLYYAEIEDSADAYTPGTPAPLAPLAKITLKPKSSSKTSYYDNAASGGHFAEGETEGDIEIQGLELEVETALMGRFWDSVNKRQYDDGGTPPYFAVGYRALKSDGTYKYYWYQKCQFMPIEEEAETKTDTPNPKVTKLKIIAYYTEYIFDVGDGNPRPFKKVKGDTSVTGFDASTWFDAVQTPDTPSASAVTCTPSPADGATSQATSVAITLTFNNALRLGAENGIGLIRVDTGAAISVTRSIDAARKVVTLTHSALTAAKTYHINVTGVTDIHGQAFADNVYDFATA
jgi:phi13 family phage major tail protein